jgi:hypothetical protein
MVADRPLKTCPSLIALAVVFSAGHIGGMILLRKLAYAMGGATYPFDWSLGDILYELRKDLFSFTTIAITFWLAERAFGRGSVISREAAESTVVRVP